MPRMTAELVAARPLNVAFIDGMEIAAGGEEPWIQGFRYFRSGIPILRKYGVATDEVATAVMGHDLSAKRGTPPFRNRGNTLKLAEAIGIGTEDLKRIHVLSKHSRSCTR